MLNDFRTLLLNESYGGKPSEEIPIGYIAKALPGDMKDFYNLIFPAGSSKHYKKFLTYVFLNIVQSAGLDTKVTDSRVTYDLTTNSEFFKINRTSNPSGNAPAFQLRVMGNYLNSLRNRNGYDEIRVEQIDNTTLVEVSSNTNARFYLQNYPLLFNNPTPTGSSATGWSEVVEIPHTGLSFQLYAPTAFTMSRNKNWEFFAEAPYEFDFNSFYEKLRSNTHIIDRLLRSEGNNPTFDNLWKSHCNPVYKVAGLLSAYVNRIPQ